MPQIPFSTWVFGYPRVKVLGLHARWGDSIDTIVQSLGGSSVSPSMRPPIWAARYWFIRVFLLRRLPKSARRIVGLVRTVRCRVVITTDHLRSSIWLDTNLSQTQLFWIMHGLYLDRDFSTPTKEGVHPPLTTRIQLLALSEYDREHYQRWGVKPGMIHVVGSANNALWLAARKAKSSQAAGRFDICLIEKGISLNPDREHRSIYLDIYSKILQMLGQYLNNEKRSLVVALSNSDERSHVEKWIRMKLDYDFTVTDANERFATYAASDHSRLTIGLASTALLESLNRGNKILSLNPTQFPNWDFPGIGISRMGSETSIDLQLLTARINHLLELSFESYRGELPQELSRMIHDDSNAINEIQEILRGSVDGMTRDSKSHR